MYSEALIHEIRTHLNFAAVFAEALPDLRGHGPERRARCPFHDDRDPSLSANVETGLWNCHAPACGAGGDIFDFVMRRHSRTFPEAVEYLAARAGVGLPPRGRTSSDGATLADEAAAVTEEYHPSTVDPTEKTQSRKESEPPQPSPIIPDEYVRQMHRSLIVDPERMAWLEERRGLSRETVERFQIGWDGDRYFIPIRDDGGHCVNIRRYRARPGDAGSKMISWRSGFGQARLFPLSNLMNAPINGGIVFLMEGEMDCLLACQLGLNAITTTGGAGTWRSEWSTQFDGLRVVICYDCDDAGRAGAAAIARHLYQIASVIKILRLPLQEPVGADFTDYIHGHGHTIVDFLQLVEATDPYVQEPATAFMVPEPDLSDIEDVRHLSEASHASHHGKRVRCPVMVSGKAVSPYVVPQTVQFTCTHFGEFKRLCHRCSLFRFVQPAPPEAPVRWQGKPVTMPYDVAIDGAAVLDLVNVPKQIVEQEIKTRAGIPHKCPNASYVVTMAVNVEVVQLIPQITRALSGSVEYVTREAFSVGKSVRSNTDYTMVARTVAEPKKQLVTHVIQHMEETKNDVDSYFLSPLDHDRLKVFRPADWTVEACWAKLDEIYTDLERWIRIYERRDIMLAVDLCFMSALWFTFQGDEVARGWIETLILGDTRTGKSEIARRMAHQYGAGEFLTGENTTLAGLVGGLHQLGTTWQLSWGRIPLNDKRLVIIDEAGSLPIEQINRMSAMRSSGVATVVKIHTERTTARTRMIWIANPRNSRPITTFSQGVLAVKELIGAPEDIARFDVVVGTASADVALEVVNAERPAQAPLIFTEDVCNQRVMWTWSRQIPGDSRVRWDVGSERRVLDLAMRQGHQYRYANEIPLVEPNEQRIRLARLAVAAAALFFSATDDGQCVLVRPCHVDFAYEALERTYKSPTLSFNEYASGQQRRYEISNPTEVRRIVTRRANAAQQLMENEGFTLRDLQEMLGYDDRDDLRTDITILREAGFLRRQGASFYYKTPAAIRWLRLLLGTGTNTVVSLPERPDF